MIWTAYRMVLSPPGAVTILGISQGFTGFYRGLLNIK